MKGLNKILQILAILGAVVAIAAWFLTNGKLKEKTQELEANQKTVQKTQEEIAQLGSNLKKLETQLKSQESALARSKTKTSSLTEEYRTVKSELSKRSRELDSAKKTIESSQARIQRLNKELVEVAEIDVKDTSQEDRYKERITKLENEITDLTRQLSESRGSGISGSSSTVSPSSNESSNSHNAQTIARPQFKSDSKEGPVVTIVAFDKKSGMLAIDAGSQAKLKKGMQIILKESGKKLVRIELTRVQSHLSLANILPNFGKPGSIKKGLQVTLSN